MTRRIDPLDAHLVRLCLLADHLVVLVRDVPVARDALASFNFDPDAIAAELTELAERGLDAHGERLNGTNGAAYAEQQAQAAAQEVHAWQAEVRKLLRAQATLVPEPAVAAALRTVSQMLRMRSVRAAGALATLRRVRDHIADAHHPVHRFAPTQRVATEIVPFIETLEAALQERDVAYAERRESVRLARDAHNTLRVALRRLRQMLEICTTREGFPEALLSDVRTRRAPRPKSPPPRDPPPEGREEGVDPSEHPGHPASESGRLASEAGHVPDEAGRSPS